MIRLSKQDKVEFCEEDSEKRVWTFQVVTPNRTLVLCASHQEERQDWVDWLREHIKIFGK